MVHLSTRTRTLLFFLCLGFASTALVDGYAIPRNGLVVARQGLSSILDVTGGDTSTTSTSQTSTTSTSTTATSTSSPPPTSTSQTSDTNTQTPTSTTPTQPPTSSIPSSTSPPTSTSPPNANTNTQTQNQQTPPPPLSSTSTSTFTNADGQTIVTVIVSAPATSSSSSSSAAPTNSSSSDDSSGIGTSTIVGLSVAGGIALIGVIAFFVWKFTRKRFSDLDDDAIKWPELNAHGETSVYAVPTNPTGKSGVGLDSSSEIDVHGGESIIPSHYSHASAADSSTTLFAPGADPYAVPPLPHMNPNMTQPYHDEPGAYGGQYDPYRGPLPQTFNDDASADSHLYHPGGEAIPMNTMNNMAGRRSPGPQMAYHDMDGGRKSPGPQTAYAMGGGRVSPGPQTAYAMGGGRVSPGPQMTFDTGGLASPGPSLAGRQSPGPGAAYGGGYGDGRRSPGPGPALGGRRSPGPGAAYGS